MKRFIINGEKYSTDESKQEIEEDVQRILDCQYGKGDITFEYNLKNENEIEFTFYRDLKFDIEAGDFLTSVDCVLISGCDSSAFEVDYSGQDEPLVRSFPFGEHWYVSDLDFISLYEQELKCCVNQRTKKIDVKSDEKRLFVRIKFR